MLKILVVSHDAGGANILNALVKKYSTDFDWKVYAKGPATKIFKKAKNINYTNETFDTERIISLEKPDLVLTGTSWSSDFEMDFLKAAKAQNIKSASFLEHWCNYRERFGYPGDWKKALPDFVFVGDKRAYDIALRNGFPKGKLRQVENPYFEEILKEKDEILRCKKRAVKNHESKIKILFLSEPIYDHAFKYYRDPYYWGCTEYEIVRDIGRIAESKANIEIKIRLHPAEKKDKYSDLVNKKSVSITTAYSNSLVEDFMWSDIVIGAGTVGLVIGWILGKKTISYIPSVKMAYSLPQKEIRKIKSFNELKYEIKTFRKDGRMRSHGKKIVFNKAFLNLFKGRNVCL